MLMCNYDICIYELVTFIVILQSSKAVTRTWILILIWYNIKKSVFILLGENCKGEQWGRRWIHLLYDNAVIVRIETNNNRPFLIKAMTILPFRINVFCTQYMLLILQQQTKRLINAFWGQKNTWYVAIFEDMYFVMIYNKGCCRPIYILWQFRVIHILLFK